MRDAEGYIHVMTRIDDVINVAGHRLSTGEMEAVVCAHPDVAECAVVAAPDELKGQVLCRTALRVPYFGSQRADQVPVGFVVLKSTATRASSEIIAEIIQAVRDSIGAITCFRTAVVVARLPKTRSGKILRGTMRKIAANDPWVMPPTIEDPAVLTVRSCGRVWLVGWVRKADEDSGGAKRDGPIGIRQARQACRSVK
jgi:propionyl-CoA synthetase